MRRSASHGSPMGRTAGKSPAIRHLGRGLFVSTRRPCGGGGVGKLGEVASKSRSNTHFRPARPAPGQVARPAEQRAAPRWETPCQGGGRYGEARRGEKTWAGTKAVSIG